MKQSLKRMIRIYFDDTESYSEPEIVEIRYE
jgi:hypothetical protein